MRLLYAIPIILLPNTTHLPANVSVGLSAALLVVLMLMAGREPGLIKRAYLLPPLFALFIAMLVGFVAAQWHDLSNVAADLREAKIAVLYPLMYLAYLRCGLDLRGTRLLIILVLLVAVGTGIEAISQGLTFDLGRFSDEHRATGPFGQVNTANRAGVFFATFLPMLFAVAVQRRQGWFIRLLALVGSLILVTAILFTYSRQSYLIGLFAIMVLLAWRSIPAAITAGILLVVTATAILPGSVIDRVQQTQQTDASGAIKLDVSTTSRFTIWTGTIDMLQDHPAGVGLGRFNQNIGRYTNYTKDAHNGFILTLAECGPLGLLALLWVFWRLWVLARRLRRISLAMQPKSGALEWGFTLAVVAMALGNLYGSPFFDGLIMFNFWILCGLMERYGALKAQAVERVAIARRPRPAALPAGARFPLAAKALPGLGRPRALSR
jgi:hypothetical protein